MKAVHLEADKKECGFFPTPFKFYYQRRIFRSFLAALAVLAITEDSCKAMFSFVIATMFWEWWFFSFRNYKESSVTPEWYLKWRKITPEELDKFTRFTMNVRRIAFLAAALWSLVEFLFDYKNFNRSEIGPFNEFIMLNYINYILFSTVVIALAALIRVIKIPYQYMTTSGRGHASSLFDSRSFDLNNSSNPAGYYNPSSINYRRD